MERGGARSCGQLGSADGRRFSAATCGRLWVGVCTPSARVAAKRQKAGVEFGSTLSGKLVEACLACIVGGGIRIVCQQLLISFFVFFLSIFSPRFLASRSARSVLLGILGFVSCWFLQKFLVVAGRWLLLSIAIVKNFSLFFFFFSSFRGTSWFSAVRKAFTGCWNVVVV